MACFLATTGHDYLNKHLHRIGMSDCPTCPLYHNGDKDIEHLEDCPALIDVRNLTKNFNKYQRDSTLYWAA